MSRYYKTNVSNNNVNDEMSSLSVKNCWFCTTCRQPENYVSDLIEQENSNGLHSVLKEEDYCSDVDTSYETFAGIGIFIIECQLTHHGLGSIYKIIELIFQVKSQIA
jgi:secreted Zn-dependent insulinase-like peptidase